MVDIELAKVFAQVAGLGGLALITAIIIFREVIQKNVFSRLTKRHSYQLLRLIIVLTSVLAISGLGSWVYLNKKPPTKDYARIILSGTVLETQDTPIRGAKITVDHYPFQEVSNNDGSFAANLVLPSLKEPITLRVYHGDYLTKETAVIVTDDHEHVDIILEKRP